MNLQPTDILLIETSWAMLEPRAPAAIESFYVRLFSLNPALRGYFHSDLQQQQRKLVTTLRILVAGLRQPAQLLPTLKELGRRHQHYGIEATHYDQVGEALLWMLGQQLSNAFTPDVEAAWTKLYTAVATVMLSATNEKEATKSSDHLHEMVR